MQTQKNPGGPHTPRVPQTLDAAYFVGVGSGLLGVFPAPGVS